MPKAVRNNGRLLVEAKREAVALSRSAKQHDELVVAQLKCSLSIARDSKARTKFVADSFWSKKKPNLKAKALLSCVKYCLRPTNQGEQKAVLGYLVKREYARDTLYKGYKKFGGTEGC